jgi:hypothetical protein
LRIALNKVGTEKNSVGRRSSMVVRRLAGVGLAGWRIVDAPTKNGNDRQLPSPNARKRTRPKTA